MENNAYAARAKTPRPPEKTEDKGMDPFVLARAWRKYDEIKFRRVLSSVGRARAHTQGREEGGDRDPSSRVIATLFLSF